MVFDGNEGTVRTEERKETKEEYSIEIETCINKIDRREEQIGN